MIHASFDWWRSPDADEDAYFLYNCGYRGANLTEDKPLDSLSRKLALLKKQILESLMV